MWFLYNVVFAIGFAVLLPHYLRRMRRRGGYGPHFGERLARYEPGLRARLADGGRVWIHAVSVGELYVALRLMETLRARRPERRFLVSVTTSTARRIAEERVRAPDVLVYFPLDFPSVVRRAFRALRPAALILVEGEFWPNLIRRARREGVPVALVNGRLSDSSFRGYRKVRPLMRRVLRECALLCVQSETDRERFAALGAPPDRLHEVGSAKYELPPPDPDRAGEARTVLAAAGVGPDRLVLLGGSTWPGEEEPLLDAWAALRPSHPRLALALAPRHAERAGDVQRLIEGRGLTCRRRTDASPPPAAAPDVFLLDTTGELMSFYGAADIVFVGKSFAEHGGQNVVEPAAWGKPVLCGPNLENFPVVARDFREAGAFVQVADAEALREAVRRLLEDGSARESLGRRAAELVRRRAGALGRTVDRLEPILPRGG
jgi:3-deoxy-D-manno-octulosonic-acid transferase